MSTQLVTLGVLQGSRVRWDFSRVSVEGSVWSDALAADNLFDEITEYDTSVDAARFGANVRYRSAVNGPGPFDVVPTLSVPCVPLDDASKALVVAVGGSDSDKYVLPLFNSSATLIEDAAQDRFIAKLQRRFASSGWSVEVAGELVGPAEATLFEASGAESDGAISVVWESDKVTVTFQASEYETATLEGDLVLDYEGTAPFHVVVQVRSGKRAELFINGELVDSGDLLLEMPGDLEIDALPGSGEMIVTAASLATRTNSEAFVKGIFEKHWSPVTQVILGEGFPDTSE